MNSIAFRLRATYIFLAIGPLLLVGVVLTWLNVSIQLDRARALQQELVPLVASQVEAFIVDLQEELQTVSQISNIRSLTTAEQQEITDQIQTTNNNVFAEVTLLDADGIVLTHSSFLDINTESERGRQATGPEFLVPIETGEIYFGPVRFDESATETVREINEPVMTIAVPLIDRRLDEVANIIVADIRFKEIWDLIASVGGDQSIYIVDAQNRVIAHRNPTVVRQGTSLELPTGSDRFYEGLEGNLVVLGLDELRFGDQVFIVVAEQPVSQVLALALNTILIIGGLIIGALGVALLLGLIATNRIVRPIQALATVAQAIRGGDLEQRASLSELSELDDLANTFNSMTTQLRQTLAGLEQRVADRTRALRSSAEVSRYLSTILDRGQLVSEVVELLRSTFNYYHANLYLFDDKGENLVLVAGAGESGKAMLSEGYAISVNSGLVGTAAATGQTIYSPDTNADERWLPNPHLPDTKSELAVPILLRDQILGVLDIQHNVLEGFTQEDIDLVQSIANQMAIALVNAQSFENLVSEKLAETREREEAERKLEAYRNSPMGRAEALAHNLLDQPETAMATIHKLTENADKNPDTAVLLDSLPQALDNVGQQDHSLYPAAKIQFIAGLAQGYNFLIKSQAAPELLTVGLRELIARLERPYDGTVAGADSVLPIYKICLSALDVNGIGQITQLTLLKDVREADTIINPVSNLKRSLGILQPAMDALNAYERVSSAQDKLTYLISAVEKLHHLERSAMRSEIGVADRAIILRISENWLNVVTGAISELQTYSKIVCHLITRHTWQNDIISLTLSVSNKGRGAALNLLVSLEPSADYTLVDDVATIERLVPGEEQQVVLHIRPHLAEGKTQFRAQFLIRYTDPRGEGQIEHYADVVQLLITEGEFQFISNPYIVGTPLAANSALFFGREKLIESIKQNLAAAHRHNLVLIGQRRMGKTSLLKNLQKRLGEDYIPVYLDGQVMGLDPGMPNFFLNLATEIAFALEDRGFEIDLPELEDFGQSPAAVFEQRFLTQVFNLIGERLLLILFDEFEELENAVHRGHIDDSIFGYLRHLMQHNPKINFIFCGAHRLEELVADYWSILFNISLYQHIGHLSKSEALRLIQEPVAAFNMRFDDLALDKLWRVTSGHPYFLQLLCHSLVNQHNRNKRSYVTIANVNTALEEILASGEAHFIYLWNESTNEERLTLFALSRMMPLTGHATPVQVTDYLSNRGVTFERRAARKALHQLALRDILKTGDVVAETAVSEMYRWRLGLLGLWVERSKSLGRITDEVAA